MLTTIVQDMWDIVMRVFGSADTVSLIIMLLVVVLFGLMLRSFGDVITLTVSALIVYGLARLAYSVYQGADPSSLAGTAWGNLKVMSVGDLVVYLRDDAPYHVGLLEAENQVVSSTLNAGIVRTTIDAFAGDVRYLRLIEPEQGLTRWRFASTPTAGVRPQDERAPRAPQHAQPSPQPHVKPTAGVVLPTPRRTPVARSPNP